jgi:MFS superfamily sulfate permease-like transporter
MVSRQVASTATPILTNSTLSVSGVGDLTATGAFWSLLRFDQVHWPAIWPSAGAVCSMVFFALLDVSLNFPALRDMYDEQGRPKHDPLLADTNSIRDPGATQAVAIACANATCTRSAMPDQKAGLPPEFEMISCASAASDGSPPEAADGLRHRGAHECVKASPDAAIIRPFHLMDGCQWTTSHEMAVAGLSSLCSSLSGGCCITYLSLSPTRVSYDTGSTTNVAVLASLVVNVVTFFVGSTVVSVFPAFHVGGLMFYAGLGYFLDGVMEDRVWLSIGEYGLVWLMPVFAFAWGIMAAVGIGLGLIVLAFVVRYSCNQFIVSPTEIRHGPVSLAPAILEGIHVLHLRGFLFFGNAEAVADQVRRRVKASTVKPAAIVLDMRLVHGMEATFLESLSRLQRFLKNIDVCLAITTAAHLRDSHTESAGKEPDNCCPCGTAALGWIAHAARFETVWEQLDRSGLLRSIVYFDSTEECLQWCQLHSFDVPPMAKVSNPLCVAAAQYKFQRGMVMTQHWLGDLEKVVPEADAGRAPSSPS